MFRRGRDQILPDLFRNLELTGIRIDQLREHRGLSVGAFYRMVGLSKTGMYRYLTTEAHAIKLRYLVKMLDVLGYELVAVPKPDGRALQPDLQPNLPTTSHDRRITRTND